MEFSDTLSFFNVVEYFYTLKKYPVDFTKKSTVSPVIFTDKSCQIDTNCFYRKQNFSIVKGNPVIMK